VQFVLCCWSQGLVILEVLDQVCGHHEPILREVFESGGALCISDVLTALKVCEFFNFERSPAVVVLFIDEKIGRIPAARRRLYDNHVEVDGRILLLDFWPCVVVGSTTISTRVKQRHSLSDALSLCPCIEAGEESSQTATGVFSLTCRVTTEQDVSA
jgi:hypothetical protein